MNYMAQIVIPPTVRTPTPRTAPVFNPARSNERWPRDGWKGVIYEVCQKHRIKIADLMSGDRHQKVVDCRWEIIKRLRDRGHSMTRIGSYLGLDHTSVRYALMRLQGADPSELRRCAYYYRRAA